MGWDHLGGGRVDVYRKRKNDWGGIVVAIVIGIILLAAIGG